MTDPLPTEDTITVQIPVDLATEFIEDESWMVARRRSLLPLRLGVSDLGMWRVDGITTDSQGGLPRAVLRRVLVSDRSTDTGSQSSLVEGGGDR